MRSRFSFVFILLSVVFQSLSGIFGKYAANSTGSAGLLAIITNSFYVLMLVCLFLQAVVWQQALRRYPLSFAYPFMSLMNFVVLFASALLFHEGITPFNIAGLVLISLGITMLSRHIGGRV